MTKRVYLWARFAVQIGPVACCSGRGQLGLQQAVPKGLLRQVLTQLRVLGSGQAEAAGDPDDARLLSGSLSPFLCAHPLLAIGRIGIADALAVRPVPYMGSEQGPLTCSISWHMGWSWQQEEDMGVVTVDPGLNECSANNQSGFICCTPEDAQQVLSSLPPHEHLPVAEPLADFLQQPDVNQLRIHITT